MKRRLILVITAAVVVSGLVRLAPVAAAQNPSSQPSVQQREQSQRMADMMKMHAQMMAEMAAADTRLEALVKEMNAASGNAKVTALAAVVNELVRQQRSMHERMGHMHQQMMGGRGMMMNK